MGVDTAPDKAPDVAEELHPWRTDALNVLLTIATAVGALVIALTYRDTIRHPERWPVTLTYTVVLLVMAILAIGRRIDYRVRAWGLVLIGYLVGAISLVVGGLAGDGRVYLLSVPVVTLILLGAKAGLSIGILSILTYLATAIAADGGWLADWLFIQDNPLNLAAWLQEGLIMAIPNYFGYKPM